MSALAKLRYRWSEWLIRLALLLVSFIMLYPFLYILAISLSDPAEITSGHVTIVPIGFNLNLYRYIFMLPTVIRGYGNSALYTAVGTLISITLTVMAAYPLSKPWLAGRSFFTMFVIFTMFVNGGLVPTFLTVKGLGLYNSMWALILPGAINTFLLLITITYFRGLPVELEEAAYIDGANDLSVLSRIILPLSRPILATLAVYYGVGYWNSWFPAAIYLKDAARYPIQLVLRNVMVGTGVGIGNAEMTAVFGDTLRTGTVNVTALNYSLIVAVVLPIIFIYPFAQKYFVKGALIGSIKG